MFARLALFGCAELSTSADRARFGLHGSQEVGRTRVRPSGSREKVPRRKSNNQALLWKDFQVLLAESEAQPDVLGGLGGFEKRPQEAVHKMVYADDLAVNDVRFVVLNGVRQGLFHPLTGHDPLAFPNAIVQIQVTNLRQ